MGPFKLFGKVFNTIGTAVTVIDTSVERTGKLVLDTFDMADSAMEGVKADLATDKIIDDAEREVAQAQAKTKAAALIAAL